MAKIKQRTHSKKRTRKVGGNSGYRVCKNCGGDGRVRIRKG